MTGRRSRRPRGPVLSRRGANHGSKGRSTLSRENDFIHCSEKFPDIAIAVNVVATERIQHRIDSAEKWIPNIVGDFKSNAITS